MIQRVPQTNIAKKHYLDGVLFAFHCCGKDNNKKLEEERGSGLLFDLHYQTCHRGESGQAPGGGTEGEIMEGCCLLTPQVYGQLSFLTPLRTTCKLGIA